jgi:hypothetical protein
MLRPLKALAVCAAACSLMNVFFVSRAMADDGTGGMQCSNPSNPKCVVTAGTPRKPGDTGVDQPTGKGSGGYCNYKLIDNLSAQEIAALGGQPSGSGGWYDRICYDANGNITKWTANWPTWLATPPPAVVDPAVLARQAESMLNLPSVEIRINPAGNQLVQLPTWLSLDPASWRPQSATASVPGVNVTAIATPTKAVWSMGDGNSVICHGPGTAWTLGTDPKATSPDCGYTYRHSSAAAATGAFTVSVTISWNVTWAGAGQNGTVPGLTTTGAEQVRVAESQALITP